MADSTQTYMRYSNALLAIVRGHSLDGRDTEKAFRVITESAANTLDIARAGVWMYDDDHAAIHCVDLYEKESDAHSVGGVLTDAEYPAYFAALESGRNIAAHDAQADPRTNGLTEPYLIPLGVTSILDSPVRRDGEPFCVLCVEHVGVSRTWTSDEIAFAGSLADLLSHAFEAHDRVLVEEALKENEDRHKRATRIAKLGHWAFDEIERKATYWSEETAKIHGLSLDEYLEQANTMEKIVELVHADDRERYRETHLRAEQEKTGYESVRRIILPDGTIRHVKEVAEAVLDNDGQHV